MIGTFSPIVVLPELAFKIFPFAPTMEGQYILKNVVFVAAGWGLLAPYVFASQAAPGQVGATTPVDTEAGSGQAEVVRPVLVPNRCEPAIAAFTQESK